MKTFRFYAAAILLVLLVAMLTGCVTYRIQGTPVARGAMNSLEPGMSYQEVVAELGQPSTYVDGERVISYPWSDYNGNIVGVNTWSGDVDAEVPIHVRYHALCIKFDANNKLVAWKYIKVKTPEMCQQEIDKWAKADTATLVTSTR